MTRKQEFKCLCGHDEEVHNFDPDSAFFGCCQKFYIEEYTLDGTPNGLEEVHCKCDEFRPDTLRYVEDKYVKRSTR